MQMKTRPLWIENGPSILRYSESRSEIKGGRYCLSLKPREYAWATYAGLDVCIHTKAERTRDIINAPAWQLP